MGRQQLWVLAAEILVKPGDLASGGTKGLTNIVTWADSPKTAHQKASEVLRSYGREVVGNEAARRFDESRSYDDDFMAILRQRTDNLLLTPRQPRMQRNDHEARRYRQVLER